MKTVIRSLRYGTLIGTTAVPLPGFPLAAAPAVDSSGLHLRLMWACIAIGLIVFAMIFYSVIEYRRSHSVIKVPWHATTAREMFWTAIPFLMLVALVTPATVALISYHDAQKAPLTVDVSGPPLLWRYSTEDGARPAISIPLTQFGTAPDGRREVVLPSHRRIKLRLTPGISSWSIPEVGFQQAAAPAVATEAWLYLPKSGVYEARCSGACGDAGETALSLRVRAVPQAVYDHWLESVAHGALPADAGPVSAPRAR